MFSFLNVQRDHKAQEIVPSSIQIAERTKNVYSEESPGGMITIFKCLKSSHMEDKFI